MMSAACLTKLDAPQPTLFPLPLLGPSQLPVAERGALVSEDSDGPEPLGAATFGEIVRRLLALCGPKSDATGFFDADSLRAAAARLRQPVRPARQTPSPPRQAGPPGPEIDSEIRVYIKPRRTWYVVRVVGSRAGAGALERRVRYHSGKEEWVDLAAAPWSSIGKQARAGRPASAQAKRQRTASPSAPTTETRDQPSAGVAQLGCPKCRFSPRGCSACKKKRDAGRVR